MIQDKSCQDRSANAEQLGKTAQQIHGKLKNDLKLLNRGTSYQFSERRNNREAKFLHSFFERQRKYPDMIVETCDTHLNATLYPSSSEFFF